MPIVPATCNSIKQPCANHSALDGWMRLCGGKWWDPSSNPIPNRIQPHPTTPNRILPQRPTEGTTDIDSVHTQMPCPTAPTKTRSPGILPDYQACLKGIPVPEGQQLSNVIIETITNCHRAGTEICKELDDGTDELPTVSQECCLSCVPLRVPRKIRKQP